MFDTAVGTSTDPAGTNVAIGSMARVAGMPRINGNENALPPTFVDAQGRTFKLEIDPITTRPRYRHLTTQTERGLQARLEILLDFEDDGGITRTTQQRIDAANGDLRDQRIIERYDVDGRQRGEEVDARTRDGVATTRERTTTTFVAGDPMRRTTDFTREIRQVEGKEQQAITTKVAAIWDANGEPITDSTPARITRTDTEQLRSGGAGINTNTDRVITFTKQGAGSLDAIQWDPNGTMLVRFEGRGRQYIERELRVPIDPTTGQAKMDAATVVRTDDKQSAVTKGMTQSRIWGGFASNLAWIAAVNIRQRGVSNALLGASAVSASAQFVGEAHAMLTRRNDADWSRLAMSAYDLTLTGLLAGYMASRRGVGGSGAAQMPMAVRGALTGLGLVGLGANAAQGRASQLTGEGISPSWLPFAAPLPVRP